MQNSQLLRISQVPHLEVLVKSSREGVKNIQRGGGYLKIAAKGREALTPPKIWVKYIYPP